MTIRPPILKFGGMDQTPARHRHYICHVCSHSIRVDEAAGRDVCCDRCGHKNRKVSRKSAAATLAFSLTALIFFIPANFFPFMTIELYGRSNSSTIWSGVLSLCEDGQWGIGIVVFLASLLIPFLKLVALFYLGLTANNGKHARFKAHLYHIVEVIGRWSMLDIFLLAVLVAILKLGPWTRVEPEIGSIMFLAVVIFTMIASAQFDPALIWGDEEDAQAFE